MALDSEHPRYRRRQGNESTRRRTEVVVSIRKELQREVRQALENTAAKTNRLIRAV